MFFLLITKGIFSAVQQVPTSRMWWNLAGSFITSTTAEGICRVIYTCGENDTYKLKWTAKRIG